MKTLVLTLLMITITICGATEPKWLYPWEKTLADYLKTIKKADVDSKLKPVDVKKFKAGSEKRNMYLVTGYTPLLPFVAATVKLLADDFLWKNIWREDQELVQEFLKDKHLGLNKGQMWIPGHPTSANLLAWAYSNDATWNPYYKDKTIATRAAVISITDLIGWTENDYYYHDKRSSKKGKKWGLHNAIAGFSLTFNAFTLLKVKDILPEEVYKAWSTGLLHFCEQIDKTTPTGPINMRFSVPNGTYYAWKATGIPRIKEIYKRWVGLTIFGPELSPAGHHWEGKGRAPDGSYNGIALHRMAELYSITKDKNILNLLRHSYRLKNYLSLPMPDGKWISPSHFNDRCQSSFANDQYQGRETHFVCDVPESVSFLRKFREKRKIPSISLYEKMSMRPSRRILKAFLWGGGKRWGAGRMHDWGMVLHLPDYIYHQDEIKIQQELDKKYVLPVLAKNNFTENFNNEFFCVRRPAYYAIFYAGSAVVSDAGATNYRGRLKGKGGNFNGFGGGGLSALWTPAGTFLLGRMTAYEGYTSQEVKVGKRTFYISGWRDWANNHIVGESTKGKIITSARTTWPKSELTNNVLTISGKMVKKLQRQKVITEANIIYQRVYTFKDKSFVSELTLTTDKPESFKELYETIPMHITDDLKVMFNGKENKAEKVSGVTKITLSRKDGSVDIVFDKSQTIVQKAKKIKSRQVGITYCRNLQIALPNKLEPGKAITLKYELFPHTATGKGIQMVPDAIKIPEPPSLEISSDWTMAHYDAAQGVEVNDKGEVTKWKDISGNGHDLKQFQGKGASSVLFKKDGIPALVFDGGALFSLLESELCKSMSILAVVKVPSVKIKRRINSIALVRGANATILLVKKQIAGDKIELSSCDKFFRKTMKPAVIGIGRVFMIKKGKLAIYNKSGLTGEIMEIFIFKPALPAGYLKLLKLKLKKKYKIKK